MCKKVVGHNKLTCPTLLERNDAKEVKQPKVQKQQPKVIEQKKGPHPQKSSTRLCSICKEYEPHNARTCPKHAHAENTNKKPEKKQKAKPRASNKIVVEDEEEDEDEDTIEEEADEEEEDDEEEEEEDGEEEDDDEEDDEEEEKEDDEEEEVHVKQKPIQPKPRRSARLMNS